VVAQGLAVSLDKPLEWAVGFFFDNTELSMKLWTVISGISGFDDQPKLVLMETTGSTGSIISIDCYPCYSFISNNQW